MQRIRAVKHQLLLMALLIGELPASLRNCPCQTRSKVRVDFGTSVPEDLTDVGLENVAHVDISFPLLKRGPSQVAALCRSTANRCNDLGQALDRCRDVAEPFVKLLCRLNLVVVIVPGALGVVPQQDRWTLSGDDVEA